ncbi:MAG: PHP domain-containing protein [Parachlamydiaceae bacterium]
MNHFRADLHCHTTCSDGTVSPSDIIKLACDLHLQGLSITDHDTFSAYQEALPIARERDVRLISGLEFSAIHRQTSVHILAYSFPLECSTIAAFCQRHHKRRNMRYQKMLDRLMTKGMPLEPEDLSFLPSSDSLGRPHIALAMMKKGYVKNIQQAFQEYLGEGKSCFVPAETFSVEETLCLIHQAKGLAVIAHPHLIEQVGIIKDLLDMPFDGIEGYYGRFPPSAHERWLKIGARKGWLITGGSDFHGSIKPNLGLGSSWVGEETFTILDNHFQENQRTFHEL